MFKKKKVNAEQDSADNAGKKKLKKPKKERKPKPKKEKKPKPKKEKKPKPKKEKKPKPPKKERKKINPLLLSTLILTLIIIGGAAFVHIKLQIQQKAQQKAHDARYGPMYYFAKPAAEGEEETVETGIESIRVVIGDRDVKGGYIPPLDVKESEESESVGESDSQEESQEETDDKTSVPDNADEESSSPDNKNTSEKLTDSAKKETAEELKAKELDPELAEVEITLTSDQSFKYVTPGNGAMEAEQYITYLVQQRGFTVLTYPEGAKGEISPTAPEIPATEEGTEETAASEEQPDKPAEKETPVQDEIPEFIPPNTGYYIVAADNTKDMKDGDSPEIMRIRMEYNKDSYTLRLSTASGVVKDLIPKPAVESSSSTPRSIDIDSAADSVQHLTTEQLKLPSDVSNYDMMPMESIVIVNGVKLYEIRAYQEGPNGSQFYGGTYYVSVDGQSIYKYDEITQDLMLIKGNDIIKK